MKNASTKKIVVMEFTIRESTILFSDSLTRNGMYTFIFNNIYSLNVFIIVNA